MEIRNVMIKYLIAKIKKGENAFIKINGMSMYPTIKDHEKVKIIPRDISEVKEGDIIAYKLTKMNWITIHRIVSVHKDEETVRLKTRGDNNPRDDTYWVDSSIFLGIVELLHPSPIHNQ
jgi:signal peptidase I